jgi:hypothetical protein
MFKRIYREENGRLRLSEIFDDENSMKTSPLTPLSSDEVGKWITTTEYDNDVLLRSYEYFNPLESNRIVNIQEDLVEYDNGIRMNIEMYNLIQSMGMEAIRGAEIPPSIINRTIMALLPDYWYCKNSQKIKNDNIACDIQYEAKVGFKSYFGIWFSFIRVPEDTKLIWKFNAILMYSTISGKEKYFGCNSFKDADFERLASFVGFESVKDFMKIADTGDDETIAKTLCLKPCKRANIFSLCNNFREGTGQ